MKHIILLLSFFLVAWQVVAQNTSDLAVIKGHVEIEDGESAAFATIVVNSTETGEMVKAGNTGEAGDFIIPGLQAGSYTVNVSYVGYGEYQSEVIEMISGQEFELDVIRLSSASEELTEVVVKAKRPMIEVKPDKTIFNVDGSINAQGNNALELLRKAPGVVLDNNENIMLLGKTGVIIYIDGKPSPLAGQDLANYLKGLDASIIDNIEVITNPSSKYEAQGNAGILNIRLKKNQSVGTNGSVNAGVAHWVNTNYNAGLMLNHRTEKTNIFGSYNYSNFEGDNFMIFERTVGSILFDQDANMHNLRKSHNAKVGVDYFLNEKSTLGVIVNSFNMDGSNRNVSRSDIIYDKNSGKIDSILVANNNVDSDRENYNFNLNYAFDNRKGKSLNIDLDYGTFAIGNAADQPNSYLDGESEQVVREVNYFSDAETDIDIYTAKVDAESPLFKGNFSYGAKFALVTTNNDFKFYNRDENDELSLDINRTNRFKYDENVNAGYVNFQKGNETWSIQLGLRVEHTHSVGTLYDMEDNIEQENDNDYVDFFPSGGVTYNINPTNTLRLTYSRRLNRPNYQDMNPFEFKLDELAFQKGNPFLTPEYTNNIQIGHTYNYTLNTTLSYSRTDDLITRITDTEDGRESFITWENLARQDAWSLSVSYPWSPTEWWNMYFNVSGNYIHNQSDGTGRFSDERNVDVDATFANVFGQNTFTLPKGFVLEVSGFYNSPGIWGGNFETQEYWNVDAGLQKRFFNNDLSIKLSISDIFKSQEWEAVNQFGELRIDGRGGYESRRVRLNLSYNFGNQKIKSRKRRTGLDEEQRRTNGGGGGPG